MVLRYGQPLKDFGRGSYLTSHPRQADLWARAQSRQHGLRSNPAVVAFEVPLEALAEFQLLSFVRRDFDAEWYWGLVWRCRQADTDHARNVNGGWYDVVMGPVSLIWKQRQASSDYDQFGFHTPAATVLLDRCSKRRVS